MTEARLPVTARIARWETAISTIGALLLIVATIMAAVGWVRLRDELGRDNEDEKGLEKRKTELRAEISRIQNSPVIQLATPLAFRTPLTSKDAKGRPLFNFMLWVEVPASRLNEIAEVHYCCGFNPRTRVAKEPSNSFAVSYERFECLSDIQITIFDRNHHSSSPIPFDTCKATR